MTSRKQTAGKRFLKTAFATAFGACFPLFGVGETHAQMGGFLKTDRNISPTNAGDNISTDHERSNVDVSVVAPTLQNFLFDEWYDFETATSGDLLSRRGQHYVDGLIERGLTRIAGHYCRSRWSFDLLDASQKAGYVRALLQSQKQSLLNAGPQNRNAIWSQVEQTNSDIDALFGDGFSITPLTLRQLDLLLAQIALQIDERNTLNRDAVLQSNEQLAVQTNAAISRIDAELNRVSQRIAAQPASSSVSVETTQLMTFAKLLRFQKAIALRLLSQCQPERQNELLTQAISTLQPMITAGTSSNATLNTASNAASHIVSIASPTDSVQGTLAVLATLEAITCRRMLQQYDEAETLAGSLRNRDGLSMHQRSQLLALDVSLALDRRDELKTHKALQAVETAIANHEPLAKTRQIKHGLPELLLARMQAYLFYWRRNLETQASVSHIVGTTTAPNITVCRQMVVETLQRFDRDFAPYWRYKAEQIMSRNAAFFGNDPVFVELRADTLTRQGNVDEAIGRYDALATLFAASDPNEAFRVARKAAMLLADNVDQKWQQLISRKAELTNEQINDAKSQEQSLVDRLRNLAKSQPKHPEAVETHLAAVYHAARLFQIEAIDLDTYLSLLREHYLTWPQSKQADLIRLQTAKLLLHASKFREAIDVLTAVTNQSPGAIDAVMTAEQSFDRLRLTESSVNAAVESEAVPWFYRRLLNANDVITSDWNEADAHCLLCTAKFGLLYAGIIERNKTSNSHVDLSAAYESVEKILQIGLAHCKSPTPEWRAEVDSMLLSVLVAQGKTDEAAQLLHELRQWDVGNLMATLDRLQQLADRTPPTNRPYFGQLRLDLIEMIEQQLQAGTPQQQATPLSPQQLQHLQTARADALADIGQVQESLDLMGRLLRQSPGNVELLVALARILERQSDAKSRDLALRTWQNTEQRSLSRSEPWWEAKEAIIRLLVTSGNTEQRQQAETMLEMLLILNPELDGPDRKLRLESLVNQSKK